METELRRQRSILRVSGLGVLAFTLWAIVKPFLIVLLAPEETASYDSEVLLSTEGMIALLIALLLILLVFALRLYIGFSAIAEGNGKRKGRGYVVLALIFFSIQLLFLVVVVGFSLFSQEVEITLRDFTAEVILEISSMAAMGETAFTAIRTKKLARAIKQEH